MKSCDTYKFRKVVHVKHETREYDKIVYVIKDHKGNEYDTIKELVDAYNIDYMLFMSRISKGKSLEEALTTPKAKTVQIGCLLKQAGFSRNVADHEGNVFESFTEMCKYWGKIEITVANRLKNGITLQDALEQERIRPTVIQKVKQVIEEPKEERTDHLGRVFKSTDAMCRHYGVTSQAYRMRITLGWTQRSALIVTMHDRTKETTIRDLLEQHGEYITDHKGRVWKSAGIMCEAYGMSPAIVSKRLCEGDALADILPARRKRRKSNKNKSSKQRTIK